MIKAITVVVTGGGSGGHITPNLSVAHELKAQAPGIKVVYIAQKGDKLGDIPRKSPDIDQVYSIRAGKFRRYHGESIWQHLADWRTIALNIRDGFFVIIGTWQAIRMLGKVKPEVIFVKGGFVGVPVGIAARLRRIPFITHDSDVIPGLANRIIAPWAKLHATGMPAEFYAYPEGTTVYTGTPIQPGFKSRGLDDRSDAKKSLGFGLDAQVLLVVGGGLGAQRINSYVVDMAPELLKSNALLEIVHIAGRDNEAALRKNYQDVLGDQRLSRIRVIGYSEELYSFSAAADLIITRASATALAEFSAQRRACIVIPNPQLTGGHQLKNADRLAKTDAIVVFLEDEGKGSLLSTVQELLSNPKKRKTLEDNFSKLAKQDAAEQIASLLLKEANSGR